MRGTRGARAGARQSRRLGLAAAALVVLAAGCGPSGAAEEDTSPARDEAVATGTSTEPETDAVDDMRAASEQRLAQIATADGATLEEATDVDLTTQGAGEGNEAQHVLTLVSADWQTGDGAVRGLSRVGNVVLHDGSLVSQWLELTFTCTGELDEEAWTAVIDDVRPVMEVDGEGWDGLTPDDL